MQLSTHKIYVLVYTSLIELFRFSIIRILSYKKTMFASIATVANDPAKYNLGSVNENSSMIGVTASRIVCPFWH